MDKFWTDVILKPIFERLGSWVASSVITLGVIAGVDVQQHTAQAVALGVVAAAGLCVDLALAWRRKKKDQRKGALNMREVLNVGEL